MKYILPSTLSVAGITAERQESDHQDMMVSGFWGKSHGHCTPSSFSSTMPPSPLDIQELVNHCITLAADDMPACRTPTLLACALVARSWVETAQSLLFRAPHVARIDLWDPSRGSPLAKLHRTLDTSPHLLRHVRDLNIFLIVDSVVKLPSFMKFCDLPFTHVETISIFIRRDLGKGYSRGIRKLFSLPTPVSLRLDAAIYDVSSLAQIWEFCSPSIRHLELIADIELLDEPWAQIADFIPEVPIQLDSLRVVFNSELDHIDVYPFALYPFDLSHLKALSIRDNTGVPWQRFNFETIQLLDVDATVCTFIHATHRSLTLLRQRRWKSTWPYSQMFRFSGSHRLTLYHPWCSQHCPRSRPSIAYGKL
jgi:hypothetical protein